MNKTELIDRGVAKAGISHSAAGDRVEALLATVEATLERGETVSILGFGTFSIRDIPPHTGRNPATGASIDIPGRRVAQFKSGSGLKHSLDTSLASRSLTQAMTVPTKQRRSLYKTPYVV